MTQGFVELMQELQGGDSQELFARRIGVTQAMVSAIYRGVRQPGAKVLRGLLAAYPNRASDLQRVFLASDNN